VQIQLRKLPAGAQGVLGEKRISAEAKTWSDGLAGLGPKKKFGGRRKSKSGVSFHGKMVDSDSHGKKNLPRNKLSCRRDGTYIEKLSRPIRRGKKYGISEF